MERRSGRAPFPAGSLPEFLLVTLGKRSSFLSVIPKFMYALTALNDGIFLEEVHLGRVDSA
jgi:hypothetical protein